MATVHMFSSEDYQPAACSGRLLLVHAREQEAYLLSQSSVTRIWKRQKHANFVGSVCGSVLPTAFTTVFMYGKAVHGSSPAD